MTVFLAAYGVIALTVFVGAAVVALNGSLEHDREVARTSARLALLCWAWPVGAVWLIVRLVRLALPHPEESKHAPMEGTR